MTEFCNLTARNCKLFFKDKGVFFKSLITPLILLVLYATFLAKVYKNSFIAGIPQGISISEKLINAAVGGQLVSSLLAVSCVTVAFCCNMISVQDKVSGARRDLTVSPVKKSTLAISYYTATLISTLIVCLLTSVICLIYLGKIGWYLNAKDIALAALDIVLLVLFGTALSSIINCFLKTQGQISAVGTIVRSGYGFICGAYMPISQFGSGLQKVLSFLPGTYATSLLRNHALAGVFREMESLSFPKQAIDAIKDSVDCNIYFFDKSVPQSTMYIYLAACVAALVAIYALISAKKKG